MKSAAAGASHGFAVRSSALWVAVFCATALVYAQTFRAEFIWNDADYVTKPELRGLGGLWRIWTEPATTLQYYPLLHTFFWIQHILWGDSPLGYHVVNVLLHATAACLLGAVVRRLLAPERRSVGAGKRGNDGSGDAESFGRSERLATIGAWFAAALFALHPVYVESVAWISEQKNTLSTVFYLWATLAYLGWGDGRGPSPAAPAATPTRTATKNTVRQATSALPTAIRPYLIASFLFLCALLSKSLTATLPAGLLIVLWWKRGRVRSSDVLPLVPWFAVGAIVGLFTAWVEHTYLGAQGADFDLTLLERALLAARVIWFYLGKLVWPAELMFIYPHWRISASDPTQWIYPIAAVALLAALFALRKRSRAPLAAYLFFVVTLFPTIGFFNVYAFKFSFVADHWQYLPSIGMVVLAAAGLAHIAVQDDGAIDPRNDRKALAKPVARPHRWLVVPTCFALLCLVLAVLSWRLTPGYHDMETFYREILDANGESFLAANNLGQYLLESGRAAEAVPFLQRASELRPTDREPPNNLAVALHLLGRDQEAADELLAATRKFPNDAVTHFNFGNFLFSQSRFAEAAEQYRAAISTRPDDARSHNSLATTLRRLGRNAEAIEEYKVALAIQPQYPLAHSNLGSLYKAMGSCPQALEEFELAMRQGPPSAELHVNAGECLVRMERFADAITHFESAVRLNPSSLNARAELVDAQQKAARAQPPAVGR